MLCHYNHLKTPPSVSALGSGGRREKKGEESDSATRSTCLFHIDAIKKLPAEIYQQCLSSNSLVRKRTRDNSSSSASFTPPRPLVAYQSISTFSHPSLWLSLFTVAFEQTASSAMSETLDVV